MKKILLVISALLFLSFGFSLYLDYTVNKTTDSKVEQPKTESIQTKETEKALKNKQESPSETVEINLEPSGDLVVHYIDAGQGDAALLEYADDDKTYRILYDVGDWRGNEVVPYLQSRDVSLIDVIIVSHPHADHIGQLEKVMNNFNVGEVWMSGNTADTQTFQSAIESVIDSEADYLEPTVGDVMDIGPLQLKVVHPGALTGGLNEDSLSIKFTYGSVSFLFTGDAYKSQEKQMISKIKNLQADFLQLGHHGSNTSTDEEFLNVIQPKYAIYSAGVDNKYGHPHQETLDLLNEHQIVTYGTAIHGTIIVTTDGENSTVETTKGN